MQTVSKSILLQELNRTILGCSKKQGTYSPDTVQLREGFWYAFNDVVGTKVKAPWAEPDLNFSVHGETIVNAIKAIKEENVTIGVKDGILHVKGGNKRSKITIVEDRVKQRYDEVYPFDELWKALPSGITNAMKIVTVPSYAKVSGVFSSGEHLLVLDNSFAIRTVVEGQLDDMWLAYNTASIIQEFGEPNEVAVRASWAHFRNGEDLISVRKLIEANYPLRSVYRLFDAPGDTLLSGSLPPEILKSILTLMHFCDRNEEGTFVGKITFSADSMLLTAESKGAMYEEDVPAVFSCEEPITVTCDMSAFVRCIRRLGQSRLSLVKEPKLQKLMLNDGKTEAVIAIE